MPVGSVSLRSLKVSIITIILIVSFSVMPSMLSTGLRYIGGDVSETVTSNLMGDIISIGDLNNDGRSDLALLLPHNSSFASNGGTVHIFLGEADGFPVITPQNADVTFYGKEDFLLGTSILAWDLKDNSWAEIVLGCPGAGNGNGTVFIFDSVLVNGAPKGTVIGTDQAYIHLNGTDVHGFGSHLIKGEFTVPDREDLVVLSTKDDTRDPKMTLYVGGGSPGHGVQFDLPALSITPFTNTLTMDLMGKGRDALIYSTPDRGQVRVEYFDINETIISLPGANSTGVVDLQGSIFSTGNTWGWGNGDDGWDTSPSHLYDFDSGVDSLRFNQATGNVNGYDRSVENVNRLDIEIGGIPSSSGGDDESGAYGVTFHISSGDLDGKNSAILGFDYKYENWGFENDERLWIKSRLTDSTGTVHWLGDDLDSTPSPDSSLEIWTQNGRNSGGSGIEQSGGSHYEIEIIHLLSGPGEYYLELGGKISRWTAGGERASMGFDNMTLVTRSLEVNTKLMTGSNGIGTSLYSADVNGDGLSDLLLGNPVANRVRVFFGEDPHWDTMPGINAEMDNVTIDGEDGDFGTSMLVMGTSDFTPDPSLFISSPSRENQYLPWQSGEGTIVRLDTPLAEGTIDPWQIGFSIPAPNGSFSFGFSMIGIEDPDGDGYPQYMIASLDGSDRLYIHQYDRGPSYPSLSIDSPNREFKLSGLVEIKATTSDIDLDVDPWDIRFYISIDNKSWAPVGNGTPDRVEGYQATKVWNTSNDENRIYFLKIEVTDAFGLTTERFTNSVEVINHGSPTVFLNYPGDGTELKGNEEVTARVMIPSKDELSPPVRFLYSRNNETWLEFANLSEPKPGSDVDFAVILNTETIVDGPIWFKINATTVYGLGKEDRNIVPCTIDNAYSPEIEFTGNYTGNLTGMLNVTVRVSDIDDDLIPPVELFYRDPALLAWESLGNMSGPFENDTFFLEIDTLTLINGLYQLKVEARDETFNEVEAILNVTLSIHNLYTPVLSFKNIEEGSVISGISRIQVSVTDTDANYAPTAVKIFYRYPDVEIWNRIPQVLVTNGVATVDWDTTVLPNGEYDLLAEIVDSDNLSASVEVYGVVIKNIKKPIVEGDLIMASGPLSGTIRITFNLTDDQEIPVRSIQVEVFIFDHWEELPGVKRETPNLTFTPDIPIRFIVDWDTTAIDELGGRLYPDGPGYQIRIRVTDPDGEEDSWVSVVSYKIDNTDFVPDSDPAPSGNGSSIDPGMLAILILVGLVILALLIVGFFIWIGRRSEKKGSLPAMDRARPKKKKEEPPEQVAEEPKKDIYSEHRDSDIYSPPGWGSSDPGAQMTGYDDDIPSFTAGSDDFFGTSADIGKSSQPDDIQMGGSRKKAPKKSRLGDIEVDLKLPEGAMPAVSAQDMGEDWEDVEDWLDEEGEEEWEELDEVDDDEEWEDEEEEEPEEILVVTCKCGEEIEIPSTFSGSKFKCPSCGRTGKLRK